MWNNTVLNFLVDVSCADPVFQWSVKKWLEAENLLQTSPMEEYFLKHFFSLHTGLIQNKIPQELNKCQTQSKAILTYEACAGIKAALYQHCIKVNFILLIFYLLFLGY